MSRRWGPARVAHRLGPAVPPLGRVLRRYGVPPLRSVDPGTGTGTRIRTRRPTPRRYERAAPGELVQVDVKRLGSIPDDGRHRPRVLVRAAGRGQRPHDFDLEVRG